MKKVKLTFWIIGFGCGMVVTGIIGALLTLNSQMGVSRPVTIENTAPELSEDNGIEANDKQFLQDKETSEQYDVKTESITEENEIKDSEQKQNDIETSVEHKTATYCELTIPNKSSASEICEILEKNGVVEDGKAFLDYIKEQKKQTSLKSGHYSLPINANYEALLAELIG